VISTSTRHEAISGGTRVFFLIDTSVVNSYILNNVAYEQLGKDAPSHMQFQFQLADELNRPWCLQRGVVLQFWLAVPGVHGLVRTTCHQKCRFYFTTRKNKIL